MDIETLILIATVLLPSGRSVEQWQSVPVAACELVLTETEAGHRDQERRQRGRHHRRFVRPRHTGDARPVDAADRSAARTDAPPARPRGRCRCLPPRAGRRRLTVGHATRKTFSTAPHQPRRAATREPEMARPHGQEIIVIDS